MNIQYIPHNYGEELALKIFEQKAYIRSLTASFFQALPTEKKGRKEAIETANDILKAWEADYNLFLNQKKAS